MLPNQVSEIKQQAVIEKAQDPNSAVSSEAAKEVIVDEARKAGSAAYQLDANASKEDREAQLKQAIPAEIQDLKSKLKAGPQAIASDSSTAPPEYDLPPPTTAGVVAPADIPVDTDPDEKYWKVVGAAPKFGEGNHGVDFSKTLSDEQTFLESRVGDVFFGDWYHNSAIIIFASLTSWVIATLGGGLGWVLFIMAICSTYYRTSIRRVRRNARDDIRREMAKARLETDVESLEWMNSFLVKFWPIYAPVLCKTIIMTVDQVLSIATPPMVESLKLTTFTLGTKPPRLEHVKTYPKSDDDIVLMDWKFSFNPNDTADMTARQLKVKQDPKVVLEVRLGVGVLSKGLDVIVEKMAFSGLMRVKIKLQLEFPHIERVEICFLERPTFDYVCKPLGGDKLGFDINFIPGLESFIQEQVHATLAPMMYDPNVFPIEVAKMLAGNPVDQAIGVVQVTFQGAKGLKNPDKFAGTPDPYATLSINDRVTLFETKRVNENANPRWNETANIIITSFGDALSFHIFDYNEIRKDRELGVATFPLDRFEQVEEFEQEQLVLTSNGRDRGQLTCDLRFFPVIQETRLQDGTIQPPPETNTGIARLTIEQAKDLDGTRSLIGLLNPYTLITLNGRKIHQTEKLKRTNNPIWSNNHIEFLIENRDLAKLGIIIKDDRDLAADPTIGQYQIKLDDLLELSEKGQEWFNLSGAKTGRAKMRLDWRPVDIRGGIGGSGYVKPIGVMRFHFENARGLKNVESIGKSDPYVRVLLSGVAKARTVTWKNNLNPDFDEVVYVPVHSIREKLVLEVMDEESNASRDRSLGHLELAIKDYVFQGENREYQTFESGPLNEPLKWGPGRSNKGTLSYSVSFYPAVNIVDPDDEAREKEKEKLETSSIRTSYDSARPTTSPKTNGESSSRKSIESQKPNTRIRSGTQSSKKSLEIPSTPIVSELPKISITADNLIDYESGLLVFTLFEGAISRPNCFLEILIDDNVFPAYTSSKVQSAGQHDFNETADAMIRELDMSKITLRLVQNVDREGKGTDRNVVAKLTGQTLSTLQRCLYTQTSLTLRDDSGNESKIDVKLKFIPIKMKLDPSESFRNQGTLRVELLSAKDLPSADRNGYSDPFVKVRLNDIKVHQSETKKKTLTPEWNETFDVPVRSRTSSKFAVEIWDWDFGDSNDFLGKAIIDLNELEPFQRTIKEYPLDGKSGSIRLGFLFSPDYITKSRQGTSTLQGTFSTAGRVVGAPVKGVSKVGGVLGGAAIGGVSKTGSFLSKGFLRRKSRSGSELENPEMHSEMTEGDIPPVPVIPSIETTPAGTQPETPLRQSVNASRLSLIGAHSPNGSLVESGTANISVLSATGFSSVKDLRVVIKLDSAGGKSKEVHKTKTHKAPEGNVVFEEESFKVSCSADSQFRVVVSNHKTFGSDDDLGEATFFVSDQGSGSDQTVTMSNGGGQVILRSSFVAMDKASIMGSGGNRLSRFGVGARSIRGATPT